MDNKAFSLFVDVESLPFWINRPVLRKRMRRLFKYIKKIETENKRLHSLLRKEVDDGRAEVDDIGYEVWLKQALKG